VRIAITDMVVGCCHQIGDYAGKRHSRIDPAYWSLIQYATIQCVL